MTIATIRDLLDIVPHQEFKGSGGAVRRAIKGFSTDSRSLKKGEAFIALVGENFDGHNFIQIAAERGASIAIVTQRWNAGSDEPAFPLPMMVVEDTLVAYGQIATTHRLQFNYPVIAVAGSNGKTTTKELLGDLLSTRYNVLRTEGNLNNLIGVPAMMLRMRGEHSAAVIEIGTNTPGEIERLCQILQPTHGLITNIGREHLELLGSIEGVAREEGALFRYSAEHGGTAFVNLDDKHIARMAKTVNKSITYGTGNRAEIAGKVGRLDRSGSPSMVIIDRRRGESKPIQLQLKTPGQHTAANALAAAAVGLALKVTPRNVAAVLEAFKPHIYKGGYARLATMVTRHGARVLNDTYNANPDSLRVALRTLAAMEQGKGGGRRIAVLGDMKELGASSRAEHEAVANEIMAAWQIDIVIFHGSEMQHAYRVLNASTNSTAIAFFFADKEQLNRALAEMLRPEDIVLVKGSRGMRMEEVVLPLIDREL